MAAAQGSPMFRLVNGSPRSGAQGGGQAGTGRVPFLWWQGRCCRQASPSDVQFRRLFASRARARLRARHCEDQRGTAVKLPRRNFLYLAAGAAAVPAVARIARAQAYPTLPVRIIVGYPPAGSADVVARLIGPQLSERLGQPFVVENRPGAGTNIATESVVKSPPHGNTLPAVDAPPAPNPTPSP